MKNIIVMYKDDMLEGNFFENIKKQTDYKYYTLNDSYDEYDKDKFVEFIIKTFNLYNIYFIKYNYELLEKIKNDLKIILLSDSDEGVTNVLTYNKKLDVDELYVLFNNKKFVREFFINLRIDNSEIKDEEGYTASLKKKYLIK